MNSLGIKKIEIIVLDLLSEFEKESGKLQIEYDDNVARILEIEENIHNYRENEDIDFQVFSPRKIDNQNEEKIERMNKEKESIELTNKSLYRQIKYYSDKTGKLKEILNVINESREESELENSINIQDDITKVDEKILEYYDSIVEGDTDNSYPEEPENIGKEVRSGWRIIKEELDNPIVKINNNDVDDSAVIEDLRVISNKLERESRAIDEDYLRTKEEIKSVLQDINSILDNLKNNF